MGSGFMKKSDAKKAAKNILQTGKKYGLPLKKK